MSNPKEIIQKLKEEIKLEGEISNLKDRGLDYSDKMRKRRSMLNNVKRIENGTE